MIDMKVIFKMMKPMGKEFIITMKKLLKVIDMMAIGKIIKKKE